MLTGRGSGVAGPDSAVSALHCLLGRDRCFAATFRGAHKGFVTLSYSMPDDTVCCFPARSLSVV